VPISHHFHDCKALLARASHVKWRYTKYLALTFYLALIGDCCIHVFCMQCALCQEARETGALGSTDMAGDCQVIERAINDGGDIIAAGEFLLHCMAAMRCCIRIYSTYCISF